MPTNTPKRGAISLSLIRTNGETRLRFKVDPLIENYYRAKSTEVVRSQKWHGLSFYRIDDTRTSPEYRQALENAGLFDDFGDGFMRNGRMNIAWLRTVGGEGDMSIPGNLTISEVEQKLRNGLSFIKKIVEDNLRDFDITHELRIEF